MSRSTNDLDRLLDDALDDFERQEMEEKTQYITSSLDSSSSHQMNSEIERKEEIEKMRGLLDQMNDPRFGSTLQTTLQSLSSTSEGIGSVDNLFKQLSEQYDSANLRSSILPIDPNDQEAIALGDRQVAGTLQMLGTAQQGMEGFEVSKLEDAGETMMEDMMAQFESLGEKEDYNQVIDSVMKQLLSRDLMYDPIRQVCEKFPEWLAINRSLSPYLTYRTHPSLKTKSLRGRVQQLWEAISNLPKDFSRLRYRT
jgi:hypothetical protein